jgi:hypothetical protein
MPKLERKTLLTTRLTEEDMVRFREVALANKVKQTELLREAVLFYLDHHDKAKRDELEGIYSQQLKASTNRICGLMAKTAIEVHAVLEVMRRVDGGDELVNDAMAIAAKRVNKGLEIQEKRARDQMAKLVTSEEQ